jgi:hypothetical protein
MINKDEVVAVYTCFHTKDYFLWKMSKMMCRNLLDSTKVIVDCMHSIYSSMHGQTSNCNMLYIES